MGKKSKVQKDLKDSVQKIWLAGLGALAVAEEEGSKAFKSLLERGEEYEARGREQVSRVMDQVDGAKDKAKDKAEDQWSKVEAMINDAVSRTMTKLGIPSRDEISELSKKVEALHKALENMKAPAAKTTASKTVAKKASAKPAAKPAAKTATKKAAPKPRTTAKAKPSTSSTDK